MKEILAVMARANADADRKLYGILAQAPADLLDRPTGGYFQSIMGSLNHILISELGWLTRLRAADPAAKALKTPVLDFEHPGFGKQLIDDFAALGKRQEQVDQVFRSYVGELDEQALRSEVEQKDRQGVVRRQQVGHVLLHLLNHATHHRGQISQVLDQNGIENDYSGVLQAMREWKD
jgi:uncharacterized damage-inducible protein DinB